jgi:putative FmdB family regulatory protein
MPTYLYLCETHGEFEEFHSIKITLEDCPKCKEEGVEPKKLKRLIASATPGRMELSGDELKQHIKEGAKKLERDAAKSEKLYSNILGEAKYQQIQSQMDRRRRR